LGQHSGQHNVINLNFHAVLPKNIIGNPATEATYLEEA
jgi:hypothetical protein